MSNTSQCVNPDCLQENPRQTNFCWRCGMKLLLAERYRAIRYLGEGGFGRTFIAVDEHQLNTQCVIKQFLPLQQGSGALQKCIQLFQQEAELLKKLGKHPQIPDLLAFFEQDKKLYLIQEFIAGQDLLKELQQKGSSVNQDLAQVLDKMLQDIPVNRFQSATEVIQALNPLQAVKSPPQPIFSTPSIPRTTLSALSSNLVTSKGDFRELDRLLSAQQWKQADEETGRVMCKIMNREKEGWLTEDNCRNFPKEELRIIDQLWLKYSDNKFGFSVQKEIWQQVGGKYEADYDIYCKLADKVGWRKGEKWLSYSDLTFNRSAVRGYLPRAGFAGFGSGGWVVGGGKRGVLFSLL